MKKNKKVGFILMGMVLSVLFGFSIFLPTRVNSQYAGAIDVSTDFVYTTHSLFNYGSRSVTQYTSPLQVLENYGTSSNDSNYKLNVFALSTFNDSNNINFRFDYINTYVDGSSSTASTNIALYKNTPSSSSSVFSSTYLDLYEHSFTIDSFGLDNSYYIISNMLFWFEGSSSFNCDVVSVVGSSEIASTYLSSNYNFQTQIDGSIILTNDNGYHFISLYNLGSCFVNTYTFTDSNDNVLKLCMYSLDSFSTYSFSSNVADSDSNGAYNSGLSEGKKIGYEDGKTDGLNIGDAQGYQRGYGVGYDNGYDVGKIAGITEANDYTFLGLVGAVIDAPIQAFTGLLDFDVLGVNMRNFLVSLFSISIVFVIIKFALGRVGK